MSEGDLAGQNNTGTGDGEGSQAGDGAGVTDGAQDQTNPTGGEGQAGSGDAGDGAGGGADNSGGKDGDGAEGAPEAYEFTMPEGMELDAELVTAVTPEFKELGLTQAQADKLVGVYAARMQAQAEAQQQAFTTQLEQWAADLKKDKDLGGDKFDENMAVAREAIDRFGSDELRELFETTGVGNHPAMVKFAHKIGKMLKEDRPGTGSQSGSATTREQRMYPDMATNS